MSKRTDVAKKIAHLVRKAAGQRDPEAEENVWERIGEFVHRAVDDGDDDTIEKALETCSRLCSDSVWELEDEVEYASCSIALQPIGERGNDRILSAFLFAIPIIYCDTEPPPEFIRWREADEAARSFRMSGLFRKGGSVILYPLLYPLNGLLLKFSEVKRLLSSILGAWPSSQKSVGRDLGAVFESVPRKSSGVTIYDGKTPMLSLRFLLGVSLQDDDLFLEDTRGFQKRLSAWEKRFRDNMEVGMREKIVSLLPPDLLFSSASYGVTMFRSVNAEMAMLGAKKVGKNIARAVISNGDDGPVVDLLDPEGRRIDQSEIDLLPFRHDEMWEVLVDRLAQIAKENAIALEIA